MDDLISRKMTTSTNLHPPCQATWNKNNLGGAELIDRHGLFMGVCLHPSRDVLVSVAPKSLGISCFYGEVVLTCEVLGR